MKTTEDLLKMVRSAINEMQFRQEPEVLYAPIQYEMSLGGKRLRPLLCLMACNLYDESRLSEALIAAEGIELFHNFTLLHDDVMDRSFVRRGKPCVHVKWNENTAILSGDAMQLVSYEYMQKVSDRCLRPCLDLFTKTALEIVEGQAYDMKFETMEDVQYDDYLEMIRLKTAVLLACSLKMGGIIASAPEEDLRHLYDFGIHIGLAFQIKDDLLDVWGNPEVFGKANGGDIMCNKKTFLLIHALEMADEKTRARLKEYLSDDSMDRSVKVPAVTAIYEQLGVRQYCENEMNECEQKAMADLDAIGLPAEKLLPLKKLAAEMMDREV